MPRYLSYLPNRYPEHSLRIVLAIAAGITFNYHILQVCKHDTLPPGATILGLASVALIAAALVL